jgi:DNA-binding Xre family transcriptional regulator
MAVSYNSLWKLLIDKNINRTDLAKECHISPTTISRMKNNEAVSIDVLERICIRLDCELNDVIKIKL